MENKKNPTMAVFAPMTGKVIALSDVENYKDLEQEGDGVAIVFEEGTVYSPVSGIVLEIADDKKNFFKFETDEGLQIMVYLGSPTNRFDVSAFSVSVKVGSRVQAGDLVAEVDMNKLSMMGCEKVAPVILCGGVEGLIIHPGTVHVLAGAGAVLTLEDLRNATPEEIAEAEEKAAEELAIALGKPVPKRKKKTKKKTSTKAKKENDSDTETEAEAEAEPETPQEKRKNKIKEAEGDALAFLKKPGSILKIGLALLVVTVLMVALFVAIFMFMQGN